MVADCGTNMAQWHPQEHADPVHRSTSALLDALALAYVGRFATTRARLRSYLARKIRERGWEGAREPDLVAHRRAVRRPRLCRRCRLCARQARARSPDAATASTGWSRNCAPPASGSRTARPRATTPMRKRSPPRCASPSAAARAVRGAPLRDPNDRQKAIAAMVRAGHGFGLARAILELRAGQRSRRRRARRALGPAITKVGLPTVAPMILRREWRA